MSYFDDASLVMIPSGYKDQKVYSVKPLDGSGDLTFSRASSATRVASNGLIEKVRTNLYPSNIGAFVGYTLGPNASDGGQVAGPTGEMNARRIVMTSTGNAFLNYTFSVPAAGTYTFSLWVRLVSGTTLDRPLVIGGTDLVYMNALPTSTWTRVYGTFTTALSGNQILTFPFYDNIATIEYSQIQWETGDIATDYIATTSAAVSVGPVSGLPRLDYLNSSCPRLILEPQRSNLQLNSESFNNATWTKTNSVVTANQIASPDGYVNADKLDETTANGTHQLEASRTVTAAAYTMSVFAKKGERNFVRLYEDTTSNSAYFNLNTGVVGTVSGSTATAKIENYGNGWYRCSVTYTETGTFGRYRLAVAKQDNEDSYAGTAGSGIYIYGAQYEAGAYATSYIPTLGTSVTRVADVATKTGISSLIGQTEGTIFIDFQTLGVSNANQSIIGVETPSNDIVRLVQDATTGYIRGQVYFNTGATNLNITTTFPLVAGTRYKAAFAYKSGSFAIYINGTSVATSATTVTFTSFSALSLNNYWGSASNDSGCMTTNQALLFKTRLSNSDLAALTA